MMGGARDEDASRFWTRDRHVGWGTRDASASRVLGAFSLFLCFCFLLLNITISLLVRERQGRETEGLGINGVRTSVTVCLFF